MKTGLSLIIVLGIFTFVLPLIIQIIICKNTKGPWGLIIPILSFRSTIAWYIGQVSFDAYGDNQVTIPGFIVGLIIANIPTMIHYLVYIYYKNKKKEKDELDKMEIMDM